ncbi:MAG: response regulator, partial [Ruminococcus sp.]|nr:response regulator [Ruminococcus sp.]
SLKSVYGQGSEFYFELKQDVADPSPIGNALEQKLSRNGKKKKLYKQYTGASVLVTDDNNMNLKVIQNLLKLFGIYPDLAHSGEETIRLMTEKHYDLLLLDHMMPKLDGIETYGILRERGLLSDGTVVIALTANAVLGAKEMYLSNGFTDYLSKPVEVSVLEDTLSKYLHVSADGAAAQTTGQTGGSDDFITKLSAQGLDTSTGLMYCMNDAAFYKEMLSDYAAAYDKQMSELGDALKNEDMKLYRTTVHSLKSTSKSVGAGDMAKLALSLEAASEKNDIQFVSEHHAELDELFRQWAERIKAALGL